VAANSARVVGARLDKTATGGELQKAQVWALPSLRWASWGLPHLPLEDLLCLQFRRDGIRNQDLRGNCSGWHRGFPSAGCARQCGK